VKLVNNGPAEACESTFCRLVQGVLPIESELIVTLVAKDVDDMLSRYFLILLGNIGRQVGIEIANMELRFLRIRMPMVSRNNQVMVTYVQTKFEPLQLPR
jgi:hypothetical protein